MRSYVILSLLAVPLAAACATQVSDIPSPEPDPEVSATEAFFNSNVKPVFQTNCAGCHANERDGYGAPDFLGTSPEMFYGQLVQRTDFVSCDVGNSMLLLKGADPDHSGVPLADSDAPKVEEWLKMEAEARFDGVCQGQLPEPDPETSGSGGGSTASGGGTGGGSPEPTGPVELNGQLAMKMFGDCMTYTDWLETGMDQVAQEEATFNNNNTECYNCHTQKNTGLNYMPDPDDTTRVMEAFQTMRYMYASFNLVRWTVNNADGSFKDLVKSYRWRDKGQEGGNHPEYELSQEYLESYESWFDLTYARFMQAVETGVACDPAAGDPQ
jgi:cytochrome c553